MDKKIYTAKMGALIEELQKRPPEAFDGVKAVATGLLSEPGEILSLFEKYRIAIVADDLAQESRQFRTPARKEGSVLERMAWRTVDQRGCTFLYEKEKTRGQMLMELVRTSGATAVVVFLMKFCDPEEFDYPIYKEELEAAGIPILYLEIDQQMDSFAQIETRIQAFAEMLR
jgi:benzoyl-CoA reductase/2-hydroxyglutaryl-CoA dehydratase subunit BcrC/BadD/HgdB